MWIAIGVIGVFIALRLLSGPSYPKIYSGSHFIEIAEKLSRAKASALKLSEQSLDVMEQAKATGVTKGTTELKEGGFITSAGLGFFYSMSKEGEHINHHISMSYKGRWFARAAATCIAAYLHEILSLDQWPCFLQESSNGIYHFHFQATEARQKEFAARAVTIPNEREVKAYFERAWDQKKVFLDSMGRVEVSKEELNKLAEKKNTD